MFSGAMHFDCDQKEIVRYYKAYQTLMEHWRSVVDDGLLDVRLEDLISDPDKIAQEVLAFCNLSWEPECLDIANNKRSIHTLSALQMQGGIASKSTSRQQQYAPYIEEITRSFETEI